MLTSFKNMISQDIKRNGNFPIQKGSYYTFQQFKLCSPIILISECN